LQEITERDGSGGVVGAGLGQVFGGDVTSSSFYRTFVNRYSNLSVTQQRDSVVNNGSTLKHIHNKKLLVLCFLRFLESQVSKTTEDVLGEDLEFMHNYVAMSKIKV